MDSAFSLSPVGLAGLTGIDSVAFRALSGVTDTSGLLSPAVSSIVQLSAAGQVLSAGSTLASSLSALQTDASTASAGSVQAKALNFVNAFNQVEASLGNAQPLLGAASGSSSVDALVSQFAQNLAVTATTPSSTGSLNLDSLQSIGITLQASVSQNTEQVTLALSVNTDTLNAATTANPEGTQSLLAQATQPVQQQVAAFEAQASNLSSTASIAAATIGAAGVATDLTAGTTSDVLTNLAFATSSTSSTPLITPDLSALGVNTTAIAGATDTASTTGATTSSAVLANTVEANTTNAGSAPVTATQSLPAKATPVVASASVSATAPAPNATTTSTATTATSEIATPLTSIATASPSVVTTAASLESEDPSQNNIAFNPFYFGAVAAYSQAFLNAPVQVAQALASIDLPGPVVAITRTKGVATYA